MRKIGEQALLSPSWSALSFLWHLCASLLPTCTLAIRRLPDDLSRTHVQNVVVGGMMAQEHLSAEMIHGDNRRELRDLKKKNVASSEPAKMPNAEDHLVTSLPYLDPSAFPTKHYAGHIPASKNDDKKLFYWLFEPDTSTVSKADDDIPLLIWLSKSHLLS
jgi:hypothetical protein